MKNGLVVAFIVLLSGCASSHVLVGQSREPIDPAQVRIYLDPPASYETVALLESSNRGAVNFTDQQRVNTVIARMKDEAAELGANGILLKGMGKEYAGSVGSGNAWASGGSVYGLGVSTAVFNKVGSGIAIYVPGAAGADGRSALIEPQKGASQASVAPSSATIVETTNAPASVAPPSSRQSTQAIEPDPAKRCDACSRLSSP